ncbi:MAG: ketoacyl-ACP synthase III [Desulfobacterales bacterium]|jgi:3-oxoacyl-[acyl-carrier-protein] synthase-3|nr:ketoacyl-ACP synthase III [Desulfobacterales bacterium]
MANSIITATGSYIPDRKVPNQHFLNHEFYDEKGERIAKPTPEVVTKLQEITGIQERRIAPDDLNTSDIATLAAEKALANMDRETLDYIIVAQNFGDVSLAFRQTDMVPCIAARVKHNLRIKNPFTVAFDIPFGCPGWLQGTILADYLIKSGDAKRILVIGAEILSRVSDKFDMDCMIFADGAGATLMEATAENTGILNHLTRSDTYREAHLLNMGRSYQPERTGQQLYIKMKGHEIYKYAARQVPKTIKQNLDNAGITLTEVKKILLHQANEKMDNAMLNRLFKLYQIEEIPADIAPMIISWAGNSSVATLPIMFDLIQRGKLPDHRLQPGDIVVFASVGAGMNTNSMIYRMP